MQLNLKEKLRQIPNLIELRILYHFLLLIVNAYFLIEFLLSQMGSRSVVQKLCYLTCLNQISIVIYYLIVFFYNVKLFVNSFPQSKVKNCPTFLLTYLKTNLSVAFFVVIGFWTLHIFFPEVLVPKRFEDTFHVAWSVELWVHFFNFAFLLVDVAWEMHKDFQVSWEKQFQIYLVIAFSYCVVLLGHDLSYGKYVYPFMKNMTFITLILLGIIVMGLWLIFDFCFSYVMELWTDVLKKTA